MQEKKGGFTFHGGVLLTPMSWYHNTDAWTFQKLMIMIEHLKMMRMPISAYGQCFFLGKCLHWTNSNQLLWNGLFQKKKPNRWGGEGLRTYCFFKKPLELFWFFSVAMEVSGYIPRKFQGQNPRPLEISHEFFLVSLGYSTLFLINFGNSACYFLNTPGNSTSSTTSLCPVWIFSRIRKNHKLLVGLFHKRISFKAGPWAYVAFACSSTAAITLSSCTSELSPRYLPMTIDAEPNRKFPFDIDLNKILPDLLRLRKKAEKPDIQFS